jgi:hypothetical protein
MSEYFEDELTAEDLEFLEAWENMGKSEAADAEYQGPQGEYEQSPDGIEAEVQVESADEDGDEVSSESGEGIESPDADTMSIDGTSEQADHLEGDDGEIQDGEGDLEYDDPDFEGDQEYDEDADEDMDEFDADDYQDEHGDDGTEAEGDPEYSDEYTGDQVEEDDGEGERANSDEARESDEPIGGSDDKSDDSGSDIDGEQDDESFDGEDDQKSEQESAQAGDPTPKADAEHEADESFDAQAELGQHLEDESEAQESDETPSEDASEPDEQAQEAPENTEGEGTQENTFSGIPASPEACTNHCEDNPTEDHDGECPRCTARIKRERELWGVIATDMNGADIYPGDKLLVELPTSFSVEGSVLTANVPNQAVEPIRIAEATDGHTDPTLCWLSGRISQFTGWHMQEAGNPIWTFEQGKQLRFATLVGEPMPHDSHGSNSEEGDQLDVDDMLREIEKQAQEQSEKEAEEAYESETEEEEAPESEEAPDDEMEGAGGESSDDDSDSSDEHKSEERYRKAIPKHQKARFDNLTERIQKKVAETFGSTLESLSVELKEDNGDHLTFGIKVVSRGMTYTFAMVMRRYDPERDGLIEEDEAA